MADSSKTHILKGDPVGARVVFGRALMPRPRARKSRRTTVASEAVPGEVKRLERALEHMKELMTAAYAQASEKLEEGEARIFQVHIELLQDPAFTDALFSHIRNDRHSAEQAVREAMRAYRHRAEQSDDEKLQMVGLEIRDMEEHLLEFLDDNTGADKPIPQEPVIQFVAFVSPRMILHADAFRIAGFVAESGSLAAHSTILARAFEIPLVFNVDDALKSARNGDHVILDGVAGTVIVNPDDNQEQEYRNIAQNLERSREAMLETRDVPAVTRDGARITLLANLSMTAEVELALRFGAEGVGLYRSEFSYMLRTAFPDESELTRIYSCLAEKLHPRPCVLRTLDIGGEKTPAYFRLRRQENPLLGIRSLRLLRTHRTSMMAQFRAMLQTAAAWDNVRIMFPMVSGIEEFREARNALEDCRQSLKDKGAPCPETVPVGLMVEVPAAALAIHSILSEADFASIGSNDLTQYVHCVDRDDPNLTHLFNPVSQPLLELIRRVAYAGEELEKPVSLCGEIAAVPEYAALLIGLGLRTLSMSPESIPKVKEKLRSVSLHDCRALAERALLCTTHTEILELLGGQ